jgi:anti-anti-sigma factor
MYGSNLWAEVLPYSRSLLLLRGEFDATSSELLEKGLSRWSEDGGPMTIEMSSVTFVDSSAIHAILRAFNRAPSGCLILDGVRPSVEKVLRVVGLDRAPGIHLVPCTDRDPYPSGRELYGPDGSRDLIVRLRELRVAYAKTEMVDRTTAETLTRIAAANATRAAVDARRGATAA